MEQRRLEAGWLLRKGLSRSEVARQVGVHRQSMSRWARRLAEEGRSGLKRLGRAGRRPRLGAQNRERIRRALKPGPEALGYETGLWTANRVAHVIEQDCGVQYHPGHVWRLLRQLGWSSQRPTGWALERSQPAVRRWKQRRWPELKRKPKKSGERSASSTMAD